MAAPGSRSRDGADALDGGDTTLREARARYFADNGLGDGGYEDPLVVIRARGIPVGAFPNTAGRVRAVRLHDLHHVVTGYGTDWIGEAEIGAWEIASGCRGYPAAWVLNGLAVLAMGWLSPRRVAAAFRAGRRERNLYAEGWDDALLDQTLADVRARLGIR